MATAPCAGPWARPMTSARRQTSTAVRAPLLSHVGMAAARRARLQPCRFTNEPMAGPAEAFQRIVLQAADALQVKDMEKCPSSRQANSGQHWAGVERLETPRAQELQVFKQRQPLIAETAEGLEGLGSQARAVIDAHLLDTGALLLRGLPISRAEACESFVRGMSFTPMPFHRGARKKVGNLELATNINSDELLELHNEMAYMPKAPQKIILICLQPAEEGGESLIADGAAITAAMPPHVLQRFQERGGIKNSMAYCSAEHPAPTGTTSSSALMSRTWQEHTGCTDKASVAAFFSDQGYQVEFQQQPAPDTLHAWFVSPAIVAHPVTQQLLWFNVAHMMFPGLTYADGDAPVEPEIMAAINQARMSATRAIKLEAGDVLVLDNYRYLHGRLPFAGGGRTVVTLLTVD